MVVEGLLPGFIAEGAWYQVQRIASRAGRFQSERILVFSRGLRSSIDWLSTLGTLGYRSLDQFLRDIDGYRHILQQPLADERLVGTYGHDHLERVRKQAQGSDLDFWNKIADLLLESPFILRSLDLAGSDRWIMDRIASFDSVSRWLPPHWSATAREMKAEKSRRSILTGTCLVRPDSEEPTWQDVVAFWSLVVAANAGHLDRCPVCRLPYPSERGATSGCESCQRRHGHQRGRPTEISSEVHKYYKKYVDRIGKWSSLGRLCTQHASFLKRCLRADVSMPPSEFVSTWDPILMSVASAKRYAVSKGR